MSDPSRKLSVFPAFHKVAGRRVVVVGGGHEAAAKIRLLAETKAEIVVFAPSLAKETGADLIAAHGDWRGARPTAADLSGAALVFAATGTEDGDREIWSLAHEVGVPINCVDRAELCDFYTPAIVNRAPLAVAVGSEGVAPVLSRHVRARRRHSAILPASPIGCANASQGRSATSPTAAVSGHASFRAPSPRRYSPATLTAPRSRRFANWRLSRSTAVTSRSSAPVQVQRIC